MIDDYSSLSLSPSLPLSQNDVTCILPSPSLNFLFSFTLVLYISLELPYSKCYLAQEELVSVGHTVSRWLPTITNYTLIAGLCLQLVISLSLPLYYAHDHEESEKNECDRNEWRWRERGITTNACDAMCWSIMWSSFSSSVGRVREEERREPKKYSCFKYSCQSLLLLSTKWWMTEPDLSELTSKLLPPTEPEQWPTLLSLSLSSFQPCIPTFLFLFPSCHLLTACPSLCHPVSFLWE